MGIILTLAAPDEAFLLLDPYTWDAMTFFGMWLTTPWWRGTNEGAMINEKGMMSSGIFDIHD
jgi:hypothetical protein